MFAARLFIAVLWIAGAAQAALAEKRVALVVGVDRYDNLAASSQLKKAVSDAHAVAAALKVLGFETELGENVTRREFFRLWTRFTERLSSGDVATFFFAGHGVDLDGNYLVPRDVQALQGETTLKADSINFRELLEDLRARRLQVSFEILDACRDNPFRDTRGRALGGARGLGRPENPEGNFIMYSAGERQTALDRLSEDDSDPNSIFTRSLLPLLAPQTGLSLDEIAKKVRAKVRGLARGAGHQQFPAYYNELTEDFYLSAAKAPEPQPSNDARQPDASEAARTAWADIKDKTDLRIFEAYRQQFGKTNPYYDALAERRIAELTPARTAAVKPPKPPAEPAEDACDGLLVSVARSGARPCIKPGSGESFKDCPDCPEMVVVPSGSFLMGSPEGEEGRGKDEGPQHKVTIAKPFAVGRTHITRGEFSRFVKATGYETYGGCLVWTGKAGKDWDGYEAASWRSPGFEQDDSHPVVCVNWNDAKAYVAWLSKTTGRPYRLLSEAEAEYAARGVTEATAQPRYFFGDDAKDLCQHGNGADETSKAKFPGRLGGAPCRDGYVFTAPVMSFGANPFGLYDVHGNAQSWVEDCEHENYNGAPSDGSAWTSGDCSRRVLRGGAWVKVPQYLRAASRRKDGVDVRYSSFGFRVSRTLNP